jgi:hypothetical protein
VSRLADLVGALTALLLGAATAGAAPAPLTTYSLVEDASFFVKGQTIKIYRDGNRAMMEQSAPRQADGTRPPHTRTFYDLKAGRSFTVALDDPLAPCAISSTAGDWGDPFADSAAIGTQLAKQKPSAVGSDTVAGTETQVWTIASADGGARLWIEPKSGLVMKWAVTRPNAAPQIILQVESFSTAPPPTALLDPPAACRQASTESKGVHLTTVPAGGAQGIANATVPPASAHSCTALLRVVRLGSMTPLASGYQIAIDRAIDPAHPASYRVGLEADGHADFAGGKLIEQTAAIRNGILRIADVPPQMHVELCFGKAGCNAAQIYRHCAAPEATLVFAVHNPARLSEGGDWYWIDGPPDRPQ